MRHNAILCASAVALASCSTPEVADETVAIAASATGPGFRIDRQSATVHALRRCHDSGKCLYTVTSGNDDDHMVAIVDYCRADQYCAPRRAALPSEAQYVRSLVDPHTSQSFTQVWLAEERLYTRVELPRRAARDGEGFVRCVSADFKQP